MSIVAAAADGDLDAVRQHLEGDNPDEATSTGTTALMKAAHAGHTTIVRMLLDSGAAPDLRDGTYGTSALMLACASGHEECTEAILAKNPVVNLQDFEGRSAMLYAARRGHARVVQLLCTRANADVDIRDETGLSPLMAAAQCGHVAVICTLVSAGALLPAVDALGMTALHAACRCGQLEACTELLRLGARADAVDEDGNRPIDHVDTGDVHAEQLLQVMHGAAELLDALDSVQRQSSHTAPFADAMRASYGDEVAAGTGDEWDDSSFKSYDSRQDDRPWH